jgi:hypothetical protein
MPAPAAAVWGVLKVATAAATAYELHDLGKTLYDGVGEFNSNKEQAKEQVRRIMQSLQDEVNGDIDEKAERQLLARLTQADVKEQSEVTRKVQGRKGEGGVLIQTAIPMPMPFRKQITQVCDLADKVPVFSLRRKKGVELKDLPQAKKQILQQLLAMSAEELADVDIDAFIVVRMKQLMAAHIFEFMDELLDWQCPMKAEVCFGPWKGYKDPPMSGTRLTRSGSTFNPFYPLPHRLRGAISADLGITDYRKDQLTKANLFGIVEIKFPGDAIKNRQFENYDDLSIATGVVKTAQVGKGNTFQQMGVTKGTRVSLFRYPEDRAVGSQTASTGKDGGLGKNRKR